MAIFAAAFIFSGSFPVSAMEAGKITEEAITEQERTMGYDHGLTSDAPSSETTTLSGNMAMPEDGTDFPVPDTAPPFHAHIEFRMGYAVIGTFTDFTPDITLIQPLYSLDGSNWQASVRNHDWNLYDLCTDDEYRIHGLQNQTCLFNADEPLKSYIEGEIDRFYLKLRITKQNGLSYDTQPATIERGGLQPLPESTERRAWFSSDIAVQESVPSSPYRYRRYGKYQITVPANATAEEISALLPDTLPVEVQFTKGSDFLAIGIVDCPVTWKPLSLPRLSAGGSITITDAAEEILVPDGTLVSTPVGTFQLDAPLSLDTPPSTDEVSLVLNVCPEDGNPTGVLKEDRDGLKISLHQRPTGAASIQAYVLAEGESEWTKLSGLPLLKEMNAQPSTENSGFALVLRNDQNPYQSYLAARKEGTSPTPFYIGLEIEGGIYDGKQLILSWPDTYEQLPDLPKFNGAEGNEGNAGAGNKGDSTESGQRPNLPQTPDDNQEEQQPDPPAALDDNQEELQPDPPTELDDNQQEQPQDSTSNTDNDLGEQQDLAPGADNNHDNHGEQQQNTAPGPDSSSHGKQQNTPSGADNSHGEQQQNMAPGPNNSHQEQQRSPAPDANSNHGEQRQSMPSGNGGQEPQTPPASTSDAAGTPVTGQMNGLISASPPADRKEEKIVPALSTVETSIEHTRKNDSRIPFLPAMAVIAAGGCIGAAIRKTARCGLFHLIAAIFRKGPYKTE